MERWTRLILRFRWLAVLSWLAVIAAGGYSASRLSSLLSNTFSVPGSGSSHAQAILDRQFGRSGDGQFIVVFQSQRHARLAQAPLAQTLASAAQVIRGGKPGPLHSAAGGSVFYGEIRSSLSPAKAKDQTPALRAAVHPPPGVRAYVTG
jgi:hypothetical protein